jgi:tRNA(Ile2) C34 agmatinyltransferase TiaS
MKRQQVGTRGVRRLGREGDCAPLCVKCQGRMRLNGHSKGKQWFRCSRCVITIATQYEASIHSPLEENRPYCLKCRRAMAKRGTSDLGVRVFSCLTCKIKVISRRLRPTPKFPKVPHPRIWPLVPDTNPWCIKCRVPMHTHEHFPTGAVGFTCRRCHSGARSFYVRPWCDVRSSRELPSDHIPYCVSCQIKMHRGPMTSASARNQRYKCPRCKVSVSAHHRGVLTRRGANSNGDELLTFISSQIPGNISGEIRAEVTQSIACDLLLRKIRRHDLIRRQVNTYIRNSYGMCDDRFRFVSLEKPLPSGGRFEDLLEG